MALSLSAFCRKIIKLLYIAWSLTNTICLFYHNYIFFFKFLKYVYFVDCQNMKDMFDATKGRKLKNELKQQRVKLISTDLHVMASLFVT